LLQTNKQTHLKSNFHYYYINKYKIKSSLLTDVQHDHMFRLKLATIKSVPDYIQI